MKVLSIKEPYATLIKDNIKHIETRSWKTNYRGELYIHASLAKSKKEILLNPKINHVYKDSDLNYGYVICSCKLVDCVYMNDDFIKKIRNTPEYDMGIYQVGRYAWILEDIKPIEKIKAKGKLNIWELN